MPAPFKDIREQLSKCLLQKKGRKMYVNKFYLPTCISDKSWRPLIIIYWKLLPIKYEIINNMSIVTIIYICAATIAYKRKWCENSPSLRYSFFLPMISTFYILVS
jgi:hypothetical protein